MAEVQQKSGLIRGKAQEVLVVVVDHFHQVCKQHGSFVGRNPEAWMGKAANWDERGLVLLLRGAGACAGSGGRMKPGGDFHHHQAEKGHGEKERTGMGHVTTARWT